MLKYFIYNMEIQSAGKLAFSYKSIKIFVVVICIKIEKRFVILKKNFAN